MSHTVSRSLSEDSYCCCSLRFTVFFYLNESGVHFYAVESISVGSHLYYRFLVDEGERYRAGIYGVLDRTVFVVTQ